ncbi:MAG: hypothetical protein ACXWQO_03145 [Bdellovibrionota bacterium]
MKILLLLCLPLTALAANPKDNSAKVTAQATVQMLGQVQKALSLVSEAASQCYDVKVANPSGKSYLLSDSLVKDLSCGQLNPATVFRNLQPDAFSSDRHWPLANWPSNGIANCWAMALAQRQAYYLSRFNSSSNTPGLTAKLLGIAGGDMPSDTLSLKDANLKGPGVMPIYYDSTGSFRSQIEKRQHDLFYSASNLGFIMGGRERGESENRESIAQIVKDVNGGRMPALILRASRTAQHVILVKKVKKFGPESYQLTVYDSNQPFPYGNEPTIEYRSGQFYAPKVVGLFHEDGASAVGVFVTHEEEMDKIQDVVFSHYAQLCKKVKALEKEF